MSERGGNGRWYPIVASVIAATVAVALFVGVSDESLPRWLARRVGGVTPLSMQGGTLIHYRIEGDGDGWQAVEQIGRRIDAWKVAGASAHLADDGHLVVVLPAVRPDRREVYRGLLETGGKLEFRMVVHDHPTMRHLYREVESDQGARRLGIEAENDFWSHEESNRPFYDHYITARDPRGLDLYLGELFQSRPELRPDADHEILYELTHRYDEDGVTERPIVRTYLVERRVHLGNGDIQDAEVTYNPTVNRPEVLVTFTREGGEVFGDLTAGHVGHKLAIILDGRIRSAPIIQSAIRGGRSTITMGAGDDPAKLEAEARDLAGVLRSGALNVKLVELGMEDRPATASAASLLAARSAFALGCGLLLLAALLIGRRLGAAAAGDRPSGPVLPAGRWPWLRVGVTAVVVIGLWKLAPRLRLPTLDDRIDQFVMSGQHRPSVFELGVVSVLLAFVLVELAALIVPPWRRLRHAGFAGRGALGPAVLIVAVLLAGLQAWGVAGYFDLMGVSSTQVPAVRWVAVITLVTGVVIVFIAAWVADRWGLLSGWSTIVLASVAGGIEVWWKVVRDPVAPVGVATLVKVLLLAAAIALATLAVLRSPRAGDRRPFVRAPAAGWVPITGAITLLTFLGFFFALGWIDWPRWLIELIWGAGPPRPSADPVVQVFHGSVPRTAVTLALVAALAAAFAFLYSRPGLWREGRRRLGGGAPADPVPERAAFIRASLLGGAWAVAVTLIILMLHRSGVESITPLTAGIVLPAVLTDAVVEWRARARRSDLVTVWPLHQVQLADEVAATLAAEGIAVHLRGLRFRSLMHFFGPEVPIAVMVPVADAERAHKLLAERLTPR